MKNVNDSFFLTSQPVCYTCGSREHFTQSCINRTGPTDWVQWMESDMIRLKNKVVKLIDPLRKVRAVVPLVRV